MTIATDDSVRATGPSRGGRLRRVVDIASMQRVNWLWTFVHPLIALGVGFAFMLAYHAAGGANQDAEGTRVGIGWAFLVMVAVSNFVAVSQFFPFALGVGATRRAFLAGTALLAAVQAVCLGSLVVLLAQVERTTGGWGVGVRFFLLDFLERENLAVQWLVDTAPVLLFASMGIVAGTVFKRWGRLGLFVVGIGAPVLLVGVVVLLLWLGWARPVALFLADRPVVTAFALYPLVIALSLGVCGYLVIRRATP
jgi:hypothetical protein